MTENQTCVGRVFNVLLNGESSISELVTEEQELLQIILAVVDVPDIDVEIDKLTKGLEQSERWQSSKDYILERYTQERLKIKLAATENCLDVPILTNVSSKISTAGPRRRHVANVLLEFDDTSSTELNLDLTSLERLLNSVREAHSEASRALSNVKHS